MSLVTVESTSYLDFGMKLLDLERRRERYGTEHSGNIAHIYNAEVEMKTAITKRDAAPRRSQDEIIADIKKYRDEYKHLDDRRIAGADEVCDITGADEVCDITGADEVCDITGGPIMTFRGRFRTTENSSDFWGKSAEKNKLAEIKNAIAVLNEELYRE